MSLLGREGRRQLALASRVGSIGIELVLATAVGAFGGRWIDARLETAPVFMWLGLALGVVAGFKGLWDVARRYSPETGELRGR